MERKILFLVLLAISCEWSLAKKECKKTCRAKGKSANLNTYKYIQRSLKIHPRKNIQTFKASFTEQAGVLEFGAISIMIS